MLLTAVLPGLNAASAGRYSMSTTGLYRHKQIDNRLLRLRRRREPCSFGNDKLHFCLKLFLPS